MRPDAHEKVHLPAAKIQTGQAGIASHRLQSLRLQRICRQWLYIMISSILPEGLDGRKKDDQKY